MVDSSLSKSRPYRSSSSDTPWTSRRSWLISGAALTAIFSWMFAVGLLLQPVLPIVGMVLVAACYVAMLVCAGMIRNPDQRSLVLAWLMGAMASIAVVVLILVLGLEANRLIGVGAF